ncbi:unnamed protein product [Pleuronectes platessa]|uniref:Secreted protein n=1 Tax=Pleuronectes platessa TaxID=8262 RepID=A0A9N7VJS6_PLEPL|nr:unnamed protein product [Pleuronectes platessa]
MFMEPQLVWTWILGLCCEEVLSPTAMRQFTALRLRHFLVLTLRPSRCHHHLPHLIIIINLFTSHTERMEANKLITKPGRGGGAAGGGWGGRRGCWDRKIPQKEKVVCEEGGCPRCLAADSGPIVLLGNEDTKGTGGVHLILAGGRSLRSREPPVLIYLLQRFIRTPLTAAGPFVY